MRNLQYSVSTIERFMLSFGSRVFILHSIALLFHSSPVAAQKSPKPPVAIPAGKPTVIVVPPKASSLYTYINTNGKNRKVKRSPPVTIPVEVLKNEKGEVVKNKDGDPFVLGKGGISDFTNYNTDQGLALDAVSCSYIDHFGNLWFGTGGGGVSRYDGKSFSNYTTSQGLIHNSVTSICEDKKGNIWFGTNSGISRYNGKYFTNYTTAHGLISNRVNCVLEDKIGNIWFGTDAGISSYNGKMFKNYTTEQGLVNNSVRCIIEDRTGNLWFGTSNGISWYNKGSFTNHIVAKRLTNTVVTSIFEDDNEDLWIGTAHGLVHYNKKALLEGRAPFTDYTVEQGLINNGVNCIFKNKKGKLWIGTVGGATCYDGKIFTSYTQSQGLANNMVCSILEDKTGNLWFGTYTGGVSCYNGEAFTNFINSPELIKKLIFSILEDRNGKLWFGTYNGGVSSYDNRSFTHFTVNQGLADVTVRSICEDKNGTLWFGTNGLGVSSYNGKAFTNYNTNQGLADNVIISIIEDKSGNLWFGTDGGGVSRFDGKSFANYTVEQGLANNVVVCMYEDKTGNMWFGTNAGGVSRYDGKSFTNFSVAQGLSNSTVLSIFEDKSGTLWFGTYGGGLCRYDGKSFLNYTQSHGLPDNVITQILASPVSTLAGKNSSALVLGTNLGLGVLTGWKDQNGVFFPFGEYLYSTSNEYLKNYLPVFEIYNSSKGFPVKDVNIGHNAMFKDSKGIIWIATGSDKTALVRFDPSALNHNTEPLVVAVQSIKINEENVCWHNLKSTEYEKQSIKTQNDSAATPPNITEEITLFGRTLTEEQRKAMAEKFSEIQFDNITNFYPLPENLILPFKNNNITFDFAAIEPAKPHLVRYQYLLEGYSNEWSPLTNKTTATFGNIHEGSYTFKLKALSPDDIWSKPLTYSFKVLPPLYRTWWAYSIYLIVSSFVLFSFFRWRTSSLRRDKELLEQTVKERTIELEKLSIVASETDNGVLICGPNGEIEWCNAGFTRLLGYTFEEMKQRGNTIEELSSNPDIKHVIHQSIENKSSSTYQVLNITKNGQKRWTQSTLTPILDNKGNIKKLVVIDTDVTERKRANDEIEQKNQKITDSINYALRIQQAILPSQQMLNNILPDSFVFFRPKDIVSGDFYWAFEIDKDQILVAAVDCTGHGVPGAFMSIMGYNLLEQIVKENKIYQPALILDELSKQVVNSLKQTDEVGSIKEGMDIALCKINYKTYELEYAGAHNSLNLVRNGVITKTKANSRAIGISLANSAPFVNHKIKLEKGDCFYIFSDGYADQKGGPNNEKFFYQPFRQLLLDIHLQPMEAQEQKLEQVIQDWKGGRDQIDDMLVIGVRV